jgi:hypothetical protein
LFPPDPLVVPPDRLPPEEVVVPPEGLLFPPDALVVPPEGLLFPPDALVVPPDLLPPVWPELPPLDCPLLPPEFSPPLPLAGEHPTASPTAKAGRRSRRRRSLPFATREVIRGPP